MDLQPFRSRLSFGTVATLLSLAHSSSSLAAGFAIRNQSASGVGTALASDTVNTYDATGIFANPAVMSELQGQHLSISANYLSAGVEAKDAELSNTYPVVGAQAHPNPGRADVDEISKPIVVPSAFGSHQINEQFNLGWSITVPWATNLSYPPDWAGRYHAMQTKVIVTELGLSGAYRVNEFLNLAAAVLTQRAEGEISTAIDLGLIDLQFGGSQAQIGRRDATSKYSAENLAFGFQFGALFKPIPDLRIGFSYRSEVEHATEGELKFSTGSTDAATLLQKLAASPTFQDSDQAELKLVLPAVTSLGAAYTIEALTLFGNLAYTGWKTFKEFKIEYNGTDTNTKLDWRNSLFVGIGAEYRLNEALSLRAGVSRDQGVTTDQTRTPRTPDTDRTAVSIGTGYKVSNMIKVNAAYQKVFMEAAKVNLSDQAYRDAAARGNLKTTFEFNPNIFVLSADVSI